ncbi:MAG: tetratricopeptide repeat protein [Candidatus Melainabacteria bacterium]|nr:MAG: tetratricopeptide repeat protein [Candidatus Melainabacteria bacterium]
MKTTTKQKYLATLIVCIFSLSLCACTQKQTSAEIFASGVKYYNDRNYVQAEKKFEESLKLFMEKNPTSPDVCSNQMYLANTKCELGKLRDAVEMHKTAIASMMKQYGADSEQVADAELRLGIDYYTMNDKKSTKAHYENSLAILKKHLPATKIKVKQLQSKLKALADNK